MSAAYVVVTVVTIALLVLVSIPDYIPAGFVIKTSAEVHIPRSWLQRLATLKLAGAAGLLIGLVGSTSNRHVVSTVAEAISLAAGIGLVAFFCGAIIFHARARVLHNIWFPAMYLILAVSSLILAITN